jgi:hypothetical protein
MTAREGGFFVLAKKTRELRAEHDIAHRLRRLRIDPPSLQVELLADANEPRLEVDVRPDKTEKLAEP